MAQDTDALRERIGQWLDEVYYSCPDGLSCRGALLLRNCQLAFLALQQERDSAVSAQIQLQERLDALTVSGHGRYQLRGETLWELTHTDAEGLSWHPIGSILSLLDRGQFHECP